MRRILLIAALAPLCASCAFMNERNRPLLNACSQRLIPESTTLHVLTAPVVYPVCLLAGVADAAVVHPAQVMDDAWFDTEDLLWQWTDRGYVTECALLPLRAVLTPPAWAFFFGSRAAFDQPPRPPGTQALERALLDEDRRERMWTIEPLRPWSYRGADVPLALAAMVKACRTHAADAEFCEAVISRMPAPLAPEARDCLVELARTGRGRACAAAIDRLFVDCLVSAKTAAKEPARVALAQQATDSLAKLYDDLVQSGSHEAEVWISFLAAYNSNMTRPRALAQYIARSLARRGWPVYAEAAAFVLQQQLLARSETGWIDAVAYEWRALRVKPGWLWAVRDAIARQKAGQPPNKPMLLRQQNTIAEQLQRDTPLLPTELTRLTGLLVDVKTLIDAEDVAEKLLRGPETDLKLFLSDPTRGETQKLLRDKGAP